MQNSLLVSFRAEYILTVSFVSVVPWLLILYLFMFWLRFFFFNFYCAGYQYLANKWWTSSQIFSESPTSHRKLSSGLIKPQSWHHLSYGFACAPVAFLCIFLIYMLWFTHVVNFFICENWFCLCSGLFLRIGFIQLKWFSSLFLVKNTSAVGN